MAIQKKADAVAKQRIRDQRDALLKEMASLKAKIEGLEMALALFDGHDGAGISTGAAPAVAKRASGVKALVFDLLKETGTSGLNAAIAVEIAGRRGIELDRASVSSLLSRLKTEGVVKYEGDRYRLPQFSHAAA